MNYRYGAKMAECSSMSFSDMYFHFPPFAFSLPTSFPMYAAMPRLCQSKQQSLVGEDVQGLTYCTPRSPVEKTSSRLRANVANISTDHFPSPLTAVNFSMISPSLALISSSALNSPLTNFSASPLMYSAFRPERPAVRSIVISDAATCTGVGNLSIFSSSTSTRLS